MLYFVIQVGFACDTPIIVSTVIVLIVIKGQTNLRSVEHSELERKCSFRWLTDTRAEACINYYANCLLSNIKAFTVQDSVLHASDPTILNLTINIPRLLHQMAETEQHIASHPLICNKTGYRIYCSKVKPEVNYRHPIQGSHITIDLYYRNMFLLGFCLLHISDRADFFITKIEGHDKYFEQKIPVVLDP